MTTVSKAAFCTGLTLLMLASSCSQQMPDTRAADESAIRDQDAQWSKAAGANDLESTVSFYSDDASLLPPNAPIAVAKQAIRASWASMLGPGVSISWQVSKVEVARSGDLAYLIGVYQMTTSKDPQGKPVTDHGKLVEVWKKQPDAKWKTVADIFNSDLPPAPPPALPAKKK
jgi:ketosteroid isomerase-like protein